jgi:hypothetical protein
MTDDGAAFPPGPAETPALFRRRGLYLGYRAFGDSTGAVLIDPRVARELRSAAEFATQEHRFTGGLLYGRRWTDDEGGYLVVSGFLDAGPRESGGDWVPAQARDAAASDLTGDFTLTDARLRLLRDEAAAMYSTSLEVGWWRTLPVLGDFGPADLVTQAELVAPGGVGVLVYGSGQHWGTAYLGPDGHAPDSAGTLVAADEEEPGTGPGEDSTGTGPGAAPDEAVPYDAVPYDAVPYDTGPYDSAPDDLVLDDTPLIDAAAANAARRGPGDSGRAGEPAAPGEPVVGTAVATRRPALVTRRPQPGAVEVSSQDWYQRAPDAGLAGPRVPADAKVVIVLALLTFAGAAVLIGVLMSSALIAVIVAVVCVLVVVGFVWMSHL